MAYATAAEDRTRRVSGRARTVGLVVALLLAAVFLSQSALPYLAINPRQYGQYWTRRGWLLAHILPGIIALVLGPIQLWLGANRRALGVHRTLGYIYLACIVVSAPAAYYLAFHSDGPPAFAAGLGGLATAWVVVTGLAYVAIKRRNIEQHREWMIRSCVVTFAFVTFRALVGVLQATQAATIESSLSIAAWFCWAVPLLVTEVWLQGRRVFAVPARRAS